MRRTFATILLLFCGCIGSANVFAGELLLHAEKIINARKGQTPQAPRVSPDGRELVYELYTKNKTTLWYAAADGKRQACLTCGQAMSIENGYWHPSGRYIVMNEVPGALKQNGIFVAPINGSELGLLKRVSQGARPQFSRPNGHVVFFETSEVVDDRIHNIIAYHIVGKDPLNPLEEKSLELRGPIQQINQTAEISHPSLAPDGTTIVFAARAINLESTSYGGVMLSDFDRQKIYKLWTELWNIDNDKINAELAKLRREYFQLMPRVGNNQELLQEEFSEVMSNMTDELAKPTIIPGYTKRHLYIAWVLGILDHRDKASELEVQELIFPRLWTTDVFGAPVTPLVKDLASAPLPQKWATIAQDGSFAVFEAGHYSNRHIYIVVSKNGKWMDKAIKLTEAGTYNSSPEVDPKGEWLYFESNRDGTKGIWRARLNWPEINRLLGL